MIVDYGLVSMFAIQLAIVLATYHAWRGIKAEISALEALRQGNAAVTSRIVAIDGQVDSLKDRVQTLEAEPKKQKDRVGELEDALAKGDRRNDAIEAKILSLGARLSAYAKHRKVKDEEEKDPAPEGEGEQIPNGMMPPGSIPLFEKPSTQSAVPPGFGVVGKRVRHG